MTGINRYTAFLISLLAGLLLFIPFLGGLHLFDWDEINFAESAREMIVSGNYLDVQINFMPFWEKPPLFIWMQVLSMKLFGINEFAARFPNAICGMVTLFSLYLVGEKIRNRKFGFVWMLVYLGSILPFFYFKSGIIDPWFNLFIFLGISFFSFYFIFPEKRRLRLVLSAFFIGIAILTKGPVALLLLILVFGFYLLSKRFSIKTSIGDVLLFTFVLAFTGGFWFLLQILNGNYDIIKDFIEYQVRLFKTHDAGHSGFFFYHFVVLLLGVFPASILALPNIFRTAESNEDFREFSLWMKTLLWVVLILFTVVKTKIVHYSSLGYFPLTFLGARTVWQIIEERRTYGRTLRTGIFITGLLFGLLVMAITLTGIFKDEILQSGIKLDEFTRANLQADVSWSGFELLIGAGFIVLLIISQFYRKNPKHSLTTLLISSVLFIYSTILFITPRIEGYSQRAAIEFFQDLADDDVYVATLGYKSYAHLFYSEISPDRDPRSVDTEWLLEGDTDRDVYIVFKVNRKERYLEEYPQLDVLYQKNGFVFTKKRNTEND